MVAPVYITLLLLAVSPYPRSGLHNPTHSVAAVLGAAVRGACLSLAGFLQQHTTLNALNMQQMSAVKDFTRHSPIWIEQNQPVCSDQIQSAPETALCIHICSCSHPPAYIHICSCSHPPYTHMQLYICSHPPALDDSKNTNSSRRMSFNWSTRTCRFFVATDPSNLITCTHCTHKQQVPSWRCYRIVPLSAHHLYNVQSLREVGHDNLHTASLDAPLAGSTHNPIVCVSSHLPQHLHK